MFQISINSSNIIFSRLKTFASFANNKWKIILLSLLQKFHLQIRRSFEAE